MCSPGGSANDAVAIRLAGGAELTLQCRHVSSGGRAILELIVFVSGAVLLSLEIVASRVLAPYFGNSIYVWGSLIGVFLAALSIGYAAGGRLADRHPSPAWFAALVFVAGLLTIPIPLLAAPTLTWLAHTALVPPHLRPLVSAVVLFGAPSIVMGMVSPFAVRLRARTVGTMGQTAGNLYAISTIGSIAGTLGTSFVLINYLGVRALIQAQGFVLLLMAVAGWLAARRPRAAAACVVLIGLVTLGVTQAGSEAPAGLVFSRDTVYHRITIWDDGPLRYLKLDDFVHSGLDREQPQHTVYPYAVYMHLPRLFVEEPGRVLTIGLGGGTIPSRWVADYPSVTMDVAELDPEVVAATARYFGVASGDRLRIGAEDGRQHLRTVTTPYDVILIDAYLINAIPFHLATLEFFALAKSRLAPGGMLAIDVIDGVGEADSRLVRAVLKTLANIFRTVYAFPIDFSTNPSPTWRRNIILAATDEERLPAGEIRRRAAALVARGTVTVDGFLRAAGDLDERPMSTADVPVLTDDYAPIDSLIRAR
jgi:spermidine synthase